MIKYIYIILILSFSYYTYSQNIVPNYNFEEAWTCPQHYTIEPVRELIPHWRNPNRGTPDYFHVCSDSISGIPDNFAGYMYPFDGRGYIGLILREIFDTVHKKQDGISREYLQAELKEPLRRNRLYCVSLYYAHASRSVFAVDALGIALTRDRISTRDAGKILQMPQVINRPGHIMNNKTEWKELCGIYRSRGNEKYLTIGNFFNNEQTQFVENTDEYVDSNFVYAYYYFDAVRVFEIDSRYECGCSEHNSFGIDHLADNFDPETGYNSLNYTNRLKEKKKKRIKNKYNYSILNDFQKDSLLLDIHNKYNENFADNYINTDKLSEREKRDILGKLFEDYYDNYKNNKSLMSEEEFRDYLNSLLYDYYKNFRNSFIDSLHNILANESIEDKMKDGFTDSLSSKFLDKYTRDYWNKNHYDNFAKTHCSDSLLASLLQSYRDIFFEGLFNIDLLTNHQKDSLLKSIYVYDIEKLFGEDVSFDTFLDVDRDSLLKILLGYKDGRFFGKQYNFDNITSTTADSLLSEFYKNISNSLFGDDKAYNYLSQDQRDSLLFARYRNQYEYIADLTFQPPKPEVEYYNPIGHLESGITEEAFKNIQTGDSFRLNRIFFEFNSAELLTASYAELDNLANILQENQNINIEIRGHTDDVGSNAYNRRLSNNRANAVYKYLLSRDISSDRMEYNGYGSRMPIADNKTSEGRAKNRRVEIVITDL